MYSGELITELAAVVERAEQSARAQKNSHSIDSTRDVTNTNILCVDDYVPMLALYLRLLGQNGYKVFATSSGHSALGVFQAKAGGIDAVILDFQMPGMNGVELAALLKSKESTLPILMIASGAPKLAEMAPFVDMVIAKGGPLHSILTQLRRLLALSQPPIRR